MPYLDEETLYRKYMEFFATAERKRRWSVFDDIPWELAEGLEPNPDLALCAETFCAVESYLPDYVREGLNLGRDSFGQSWWHVNWGYEEAKHALALREYLVRTGARSAEHMFEFERTVLSKRWKLPFDTIREMICYGALQEKTTWMIYRRQLAAAREVGDELLAAIYRRISRDEAAHGSFYMDMLSLLVAEDRPGIARDMANVLTHFTMPAYDLVPDYEDRVRVMRSVGIDRGAFLREVVLPTLTRIGLSRQDLALANARRREDATAQGDGRPIPDGPVAGAVPLTLPQ